MSTTRSQKSENVSDGFVSPVVVENPCFSEQDASTARPSKPKSPRIENSLLESLRASLKEEITSEIKNLLFESQKEMMKLLRPETREDVRENIEEEVGIESRGFYTPTRSVRISSTQNDQDIIRNSLYYQKPQRTNFFRFFFKEVSSIRCISSHTEKLWECRS